jgi:serpin B
MLNELTRFVLTNALYMKAKWQSPFTKQATKAAPFHRLDGSTATSQQMFAGGYRRYAAGTGYQAIQLDYVGGLSMAVIVPDASTFRAFEASLDGARLRAILEALGSTTTYEYVALRMPKFEFRMATPLRATLSTLGMPSAFDELQADFSRMTPEERVLLHGVAHEAFISVDEEGTEAAAATAVFGGATGGPSRVIELTIDRPFVFLIRDDQTGAILFFGRVLDPSAR